VRMKILIVTNQKYDEKNTEIRLRDEMTRRGHELSMIDIDDLDKGEKTEKGQRVSKCRVLQKFFLYHQSYRARHILAPALQKHMLAHQYDVILPMQIYAAEVVSALVKKEENATAFTVMVSTENRSLPRKAKLACDDYVVTNERAIRTFMEWGINIAQIHYVNVSDHAIRDICDLIDTLAVQWMETTDVLTSEHPL